MDILKKAHANINQCIVDEQSTKFQGNDLEGSQIVTFSSQKSKEYTLRSVLFFLLHTDKPLKEYVTLCKKNNISPISYVDKASILSDIENYEVGSIKGFFVYPNYSNPDDHYSICNIKSRNTIIIPSSLTSKIHMGNVEKLFSEGIYEQKPNDPICNNTRRILIKEIPFEITNDFTTIQDWEQIKAVFIENFSSPEAFEILSKCPKDTVLFTFKDERNFNSFKIEISGSTVKNFQDLIDVLII